MQPGESLEEQVARLTEERDYWRDEARRNASVNQMDQLRRLFGLTPSEAWVVGTLWRAKGAAVRRERLEEDLPGKDFDEREAGSNVVQVFVCRARKKLGRPDSIISVKPHGYRLCPRIVERLDTALKGLRQ